MHIEVVPATADQSNIIRQMIVDDMAAVLCRNPETLTDTAACEAVLAEARFSSGVIAAFKFRAIEVATGQITHRPACVSNKSVRSRKEDTDRAADRVSKAIGKLAEVMAQVSPGSDFLFVSYSQRDAS